MIDFILPRFTKKKSHFDKRRHISNDWWMCFQWILQNGNSRNNLTDGVTVRVALRVEGSRKVESLGSAFNFKGSNGEFVHLDLLVWPAIPTAAASPPRPFWLNPYIKVNWVIYQNYSEYIDFIWFYWKTFRENIEDGFF